jgi:cyclopropane-fatty-acyl-phospholipid synthase
MTMATKEDMSQAYDYLDEFFRASFGPHFDISCAFFDGDFSKSLEQAQDDKHESILDAIGCSPGSRVLDIGCGYGPMLKAVSERGGHAIGLTLTPKHAEACRRGGFEAYLMDWKDVTPATFGSFDGIVSIETFEHYCSVEEYRAGKQEQIYDDFFRLCGDLLPGGGRLYLQSMVCGKNSPDLDKATTAAPEGSNEYIVGVTQLFFPGSIPSSGAEQILRIAAPYFALVSRSNGRSDYVHTMKQYNRAWGFSIADLRAPLHTSRKYLAMSKLAMRLLVDENFRRKSEYFRKGYNAETFKREILDLEKLLLEKPQK